MRAYNRLAAAVIASSLAAMWPAASRACAPAPPSGATVLVDAEDAIVVWDRASGTEHFIRRASFTATGARDFGFLVPTPTVPELAEAADEAFSRLEYQTRPRIIYERRFAGVEPWSCVASPLLRSRVEAPAPAGITPESVRVLASARVAGYDAVVLEADGAAALDKWLGDHGYASSPTLQEWLAPYVAQKWKITAFKIARPNAAPSGTKGAEGRAASPEVVGSAAVRMSFKTERPFYPYSEPADQRRPNRERPSERRPRLLRVFFVAEARYDGTLRDARWPGETRYARPVGDLSKLLSGALPPSAQPGAWLTEMRDYSSPRPGYADVFFAPSSDAGEVVPPPLVETDRWRLPIPVELILLVGLGGWWYVRRRKRRVDDKLLVRTDNIDRGHYSNPDTDFNTKDDPVGNNNKGDE